MKLDIFQIKFCKDIWGGNTKEKIDLVCEVKKKKLEMEKLEVLIRGEIVGRGFRVRCKRYVMRTIILISDWGCKVLCKWEIGYLNIMVKKLEPYH